MTRTLKALGLAALAVLALGALSASAAQAAPKFTSTASSTVIHGVQEEENIFEVTGGEVSCTEATFESGTIIGTEQSSITVHPTYNNCTAFGRKATVTTEGCNYVLDATGTVHVECVAGKDIVIHVPSGPCTVTVQAQTPGGGVTYSNTGSPSSVLVTANVNSIVYTSSGGACGPSGTNGTYIGSVLAHGYTDATRSTQVGISWDAS